ncbi:hypothetical protein [Arthrobacter sp. HLT1-20]
MNIDKHISSARDHAEQEWLDELILELRIREVTGAAIGETVASVKEFMADSRTPPLEEFGTARDYANTLDLPTIPAGKTRNAVLRAGIGIAGFFGFNVAMLPWLHHEQLSMNALEVLWMLVPLILVATLPLYLNAGIRRMWVLAAAYCVGMLAMILSSVAAPQPGEQPWISVNPGPLLLTSVLAMLAVSVAGTISATRDPDDRLRDPLENLRAARRRSVYARIGDITVQWIFPLAALAYWGIATALRGMSPG